MKKNGIFGLFTTSSTLANPLNSDLKCGFTVSQVAQRHGWPGPLSGPYPRMGKKILKDSGNREVRGFPESKKANQGMPDLLFH
jgi:hypothetical protein